MHLVFYNPSENMWKRTIRNALNTEQCHILILAPVFVGHAPVCNVFNNLFNVFLCMGPYVCSILCLLII